MTDQEKPIRVKLSITKYKIFQPRESLLTILIEKNTHVRTLHNLIVVMIIFFGVNTIGDYIWNPARFKQDYSILTWNVRDFYPHFVLIWTALNALLVLLLYPLIVLRHKCQQSRLSLFIKCKLKEEENYSGKEITKSIDAANTIQSNRLMSVIFGTAHASILLIMLVLTTWYTFHFHLSMTISFAISMELCRMLMKAHSYFIERSSIPLDKETFEKLLKQLERDDNENVLKQWTPKFATFVYFLFAPTLIYRDSYPRTEAIRWRFVLTHAVQMVAVSFASFILICRFLVDHLSNTGHEPYVLVRLFSNLNAMLVFGLTVFMFCFYGFLHVWHNLTAELLRFADRHYYDDWWDSVSHREYFRKWNHLVQEWLFTYIYVPMFNRFNSQLLASFFVIFVSGIGHEYIVTLTIKFFLSVLFFFFSISGYAIFLATKNFKRDKVQNLNNMFFLLLTMFGWGLISTVYSIEYYSRNNCPKQNASLVNFFKPRLINCVTIE